ncbi:hypothetical protein [Herbaspirillum sp. SJZ107]|uniref:hypothetical protein n=1 Tax=Herbaspirillum sp. SJZ107 TaxID=2572881 RepID=UPI00114F1942|nr:hypothetical protein [Herbaspirillum sp. SJZ107]TQK10567.1 hypothetical protein FBX97_0485 [Herbaspirillum sp. SJZ107]
MNGLAFANLVLRLRLLALRAGPVTLGAIAVVLLSLGAAAWFLFMLPQLEHERETLTEQARQARRQASAVPAALPAVVPVAAAPLDNLDAFYGALGQRRYAEQQLKTLFGLAAKSGLVLNQGEYKSARDRNARVNTYQVNLPVKGSYAAIWQFSLAALRAIPYASLDDISFRRDNIGDPTVEARLRFTLYLADDGARSAP